MSHPKATDILTVKNEICTKPHRSIVANTSFQLNPDYSGSTTDLRSEIGYILGLYTKTSKPQTEHVNTP